MMTRKRYATKRSYTGRTKTTFPRSNIQRSITAIQYRKKNDNSLKAPIVTPAQLQKATETQQIQKNINLSKGRQFQYTRALRDHLSTAPTILFQTVRNVTVYQIITNPNNPGCSFHFAITLNTLVSPQQATELQQEFWKTRIVSVKVVLEQQSQQLLQKPGAIAQADQNILQKGVITYLNRNGATQPNNYPNSPPTWSEYPGAKLITPGKPATFSTKIPETWPYTAVQNLRATGTLPYWAYVQLYGGMVSTPQSTSPIIGYPAFIDVVGPPSEIYFCWPQGQDLATDSSCDIRATFYTTVRCETSNSSTITTTNHNKIISTNHSHSEPDSPMVMIKKFKSNRLDQQIDDDD